MVEVLEEEGFGCCIPESQGHPKAWDWWRNLSEGRTVPHFLPSTFLLWALSYSNLPHFPSPAFVALFIWDFFFPAVAIPDLSLYRLAHEWIYFSPIWAPPALPTRAQQSCSCSLLHKEGSVHVIPPH